MLKRILPALFVVAVLAFSAAAQEVEVDRYNSDHHHAAVTDRGRGEGDRRSELSH